MIMQDAWDTFFTQEKENRDFLHYIYFGWKKKGSTFQHFPSIKKKKKVLIYNKISTEVTNEWFCSLKNDFQCIKYLKNNFANKLH